MFMFDDHYFMIIVLKIKDWLNCEESISGARFQHLGQKIFYEYFLENEQDLSMGICWRCILVHQICSLHFGLDLIMELTRH
jgi:hypothetical protein